MTVERPELSSRLSAALQELRAGALGGVLLTGAPGSGRAALAAQVGGDGIALLVDDGTPAALRNAVRAAVRDETPFVAMTTPRAAALLLDEATPARPIVTFAVPPLTRDEVATALSERFSLPPSARLASAAWRASGGNPALLARLIDAGVATGAVMPDEHTVDLIDELGLDTATMRQLPVFRLRIPRLRAAAEQLALIEPAPRAVVESLLTAEDVEALQDVGLAAQEDASGARPRTVWMPQRAVADRLRADAPAELTARIDAQVLAEAAARQGAWRTLGAVRSLERWYERGTSGAPPIAPHEASAMANRMHEGRLAAAIASHALEAGQGDRAALLQARSFARRFLGDAGGAYDDLRRLGDLPDADPVAAALADLRHFEYGDADGALALLSTARAAARRTHDRAGIAGARAMHLAYAGRFDEAEAAVAALPPGPLRDRGRADVAAAMIRSHRGRTLSALRTLYRYRFLPRLGAPVWFEEELQGALFVCLLQAHGPRRTMAATGVLGAAENGPFVRFDEISVLTARISVLLAQGHARAAMRLALSLAASLEQDRTGLGAHGLALGAEAAAYVGDDAISRRLEEQFRAAPERAAGILRPNSEAALLAAAFIRGDAGAAERAQATVRGLLGSGLRAAALRVAQAGLRVGDAECARLAADLGDGTDGDVCGVFVHHAAALRDADPHALRAVADEYLGLGFALHAIEAFTQAAAHAREQGVTALETEALSRARLLLGLTDGVRSRHLPLGDASDVALTRREREIAALVSQGASNQSIAQALVLSIRTVEGHLGRMYAKLGLSGRRALAEYIRSGR